MDENYASEMQKFGGMLKDTMEAIGLMDMPYNIVDRAMQNYLSKRKFFHK